MAGDIFSTAPWLLHHGPLEASQSRRQDEEDKHEEKDKKKWKGIHLENPHSIFSAERSQAGNHGFSLLGR